MNARLPFPDTPLTPEHAHQLAGLLSGLTPGEAWWISGYLAGFARQGAVSPGVPPASELLTILYGSETGHAAELARQAEALARAKGLSARAVDMADFRPQSIRDARHLMVITSTHGEGSPPEPAVSFCEFIQGRRAPRLEGTKFAVLGLGDSSYEHFCQTARDLDQCLANLGAERLLERADCDVDFQSQAQAWIEAALQAFSLQMRAVATASARMEPAATANARADGSQWRLKNPFPATILDSFVLNGRGSGKETRHLELSLAGSGLAWEPGDSLGVVPENDPALANEILALLRLDPDEPVPEGTGEIPSPTATPSLPKRPI